MGWPGFRTTNGTFVSTEGHGRMLLYENKLHPSTLPEERCRKNASPLRSFVL